MRDRWEWSKIKGKPKETATNPTHKVEAWCSWARYMLRTSRLILSAIEICSYRSRHQRIGWTIGRATVAETIINIQQRRVSIMWRIITSPNFQVAATPTTRFCWWAATMILLKMISTHRYNRVETSCRLWVKTRKISNQRQSRGSRTSQRNSWPFKTWLTIRRADRHKISRSWARSKMTLKPRTK